MSNQLLLSAVFFGKNLWGVITRPYETYRKIAAKPNYPEFIYIVFIVEFYFAVASIVKVASFRPFLLTRQFIVLTLGAWSLFAGALLAIALGGLIFRVANPLKKIFLPWAYTLGPTFSWFLFTSLLYVLIPPPRTTSFWGITFSILYLVVSAVLLFWKIMLSYLSIRFAYKLDLFKISAVYTLLLLTTGILSYFMYRFGIFKIPFI